MPAVRYRAVFAACMFPLLAGGADLLAQEAVAPGAVVTRAVPWAWISERCAGGGASYRISAAPGVRLMDASAGRVGAGEAVLVTLATPANAAAGSLTAAQVEITCGGQSQPFPITLSVEARSRVLLEVMAGSALRISNGRVTHLPIVLTNAGNAPDSVRLSFDPMAPLAVVVQSPAVLLAAGERRAVRLAIEALPSSASGERDVILVAQGQNGRGPRVAYRIPIAVASQGQGGAAAGAVRSAVFVGGNEDGAVEGTAFRLSSGLGSGRSATLEFRNRSSAMVHPALHRTLIGPEFLVGYQAPGLQLFAGDVNGYAGVLAGHSVSGRGASVAYQTGDVLLTSIAAVRSDLDRETRTGLVRLERGGHQDGLDLQASARQLSGGNAELSLLAGGRISPAGNLFLSGRAGMVGSEGVGNPAAQLSVAATPGPFMFRGDGYRLGTITGTPERTAGNVLAAAALTRGFSVEGRGSYAQHFGPSGSVEHEMLSAAVRYGGAPGSVGLSRIRREARGTALLLARDATLLEVRSGARGATLFGTLEIGRTASGEAMHRSFLSGRLPITHGYVTLGSTAEWHAGRERATVDLGGVLRVGPLEIEGAVSETVLGRGSRTSWFSVDAPLRRGVSLVLGVQEQDAFSAARGRFAIGLRHEGGGRLPEGMALGQIRGVVFDDRNGNGVQDEDEAGLPGITLRFGDRLVQTDRAGRFSTSESVLQSWAGAPDVLGLPLGAEVVVPARWPADTRIAVVQTGEVRAFAFHDADQDGARGEDEAGAVRVLVSLWQDGAERRVTLTDAQGLAVFTGVRPGQYEVRTRVAGSAPVTVTVRGGQTAAVDVIGSRGRPVVVFIDEARDTVAVTPPSGDTPLPFTVDSIPAVRLREPAGTPAIRKTPPPVRKQAPATATPASGTTGPPVRKTPPAVVPATAPPIRKP
jgi:hypothetical protein